MGKTEETAWVKAELSKVFDVKDVEAVKRFLSGRTKRYLPLQASNSGLALLYMFYAGSDVQHGVRAVDIDNSDK
eukprot:353056-Chlamydomonas_euryale.AAC.1